MFADYEDRWDLLWHCNQQDPRAASGVLQGAMQAAPSGASTQPPLEEEEAVACYRQLGELIDSIRLPSNRRPRNVLPRPGNERDRCTPKAGCWTDVGRTSRTEVMRVGVYVDGFNLYFGGRSVNGRHTPGWRWLDVRSLCSDLVARQRGWGGAALFQSSTALPGSVERSTHWARSPGRLHQSSAGGQSVDQIVYGYYMATVKEVGPQPRTPRATSPLSQTSVARNGARQLLDSGT